MATQDDLSFYICSVCFERYTVPRRLPACSHSFCEECLFQYITSLGENVAKPDELPCPLCRAVTSFPSNTEDIKGWISSLELNNELALSVEIEKQKDMPELCQRCKEVNRPVLSSMYCFECQEYLCVSCCKIGHGFKVLKGHTTIEIRQEQNDTERKGFIKMMSDNSMCKRHKEKKLTLICVEEDTLCCDICKDMFHKSCKNVEEISMNKDETTEETLKLTEKLSKLSAISQDIIQRKNENEIYNKNDTVRILENIHDIRRNMNLVFDALEEHIHQQCKSLTKECALADQEDIAKLQELIQIFDTSKTFLETANDLAPVDLVSINLHELRKSVTKQETAILEFRQDFRRFGIELNIEDLLQNLQSLQPNEVCKLASVSVKKTDIMLPNYSDRQLLRYCKIERTGIYLNFEKIKYLSISGLTVLPGSQIILTDNYYGYIFFLDNKYNLQCCTTHVQVPKDNKERPHIACYTQNNIVAVSVPKEKKICFLEAKPETLKITGIELHTRFEPLALEGLSNGDIAVAWNGPVGFGILALPKNVELEEKIYFDRDQSGRILKSFQFMAVDVERSHVIQPCIIDKAVFCFDFAGAPKFTYEHPGLTKPQGVTIDPDGAIYICDSDHDCIHIISPSGEPARIISEGIPVQPTTIAYNARTKEIILANAKKPFSGIYVFKVDTE